MAQLAGAAVGENLEMSAGKDPQPTRAPARQLLNLPALLTSVVHGVHARHDSPAEGLSAETTAGCRDGELGTAVLIRSATTFAAIPAPKHLSGCPRTQSLQQQQASATSTCPSSSVALYLGGKGAGRLLSS